MRKLGYCSPLALFLLFGCGGNSNITPMAPTEVLGSSEAGLVDGDLATARFSNPVNVAVASDGTVYVADFDNHAVRAISPAGIVTTLTKQEGFFFPFGITVTRDGKLYVETDANDTGQKNATTGTVWRIDRTSGVATVVARNLGRPRGLAALPDGRLACSDLGNSTVYILDPSTGTTTFLAGMSGMPGFANGTGANAMFSRPYGVSVMPDGSLLVADQNNNRIRRVTMTGQVTTFAGSGEAGAANADLANSSFNHPQSVVISRDGSIYVGDNGNFLIRRIRDGQVSTFAGNGVQGYMDGEGASAEFFGMEGMALTPDGRNLWIADGNGGDGGPFNHVRRMRTN